MIRTTSTRRLTECIDGLNNGTISFVLSDEPPPVPSDTDLEDTPELEYPDGELLEEMLHDSP